MMYGYSSYFMVWSNLNKRITINPAFIENTECSIIKVHAQYTCYG